MDSLGKAQASRRIERIRHALEDAQVKPGWIHYVRNALGMKAKDLARRAGISPQTLTEIEQREGEGRITLTTLKKMATAMDCELVYALIPKKELITLIQEQAQAKASVILRKADTHMTLEDQKVQIDEEERVNRLAKELIEKGDVW